MTAKQKHSIIFDKWFLSASLLGTLIMGVNKKALKYLPSGADINNLTYDQLLAWDKPSIRTGAATG